MKKKRHLFISYLWLLRLNNAVAIASGVHFNTFYQTRLGIMGGKQTKAHLSDRIGQEKSQIQIQKPSSNPNYDPNRNNGPTHGDWLIL